MSASWEEAFAPEPVPEWLLAFESAPIPAIDALLGRRFYFGRLNAADPEELLVDWALLLSARNGFVGKLDEALAVWVETNWGLFPPKVSAAGLADAWSRLANVVTYVEDLPRTARALRDHFDDREEFLRPLTVSPSRDPLGRYLMAVAEHQEDPSLAPFWWRLCDLPDGVPFYHSPYAISGLLGLPPVDESQTGGFREQAAHGLIKLAAALDKRVEEQEVQRARARDEWLWTARRAMACLPFPHLWRELFEEALRLGLPAGCQSWLQAVMPGLSSGRESRSRASSRQDRGFEVRSWADRAQSIARALRENRAEAMEQAKALLREEERYALLYGESRNLGMSLRNFARSVWGRRPDLAVKWAEMAVRWEPWDAYSWTTLTQARLRASDTEAALALAWEAAERFPENDVARNGLAELLKEAGRLDEAEAVYRQAVVDFPDDDYARNGLATLLREMGRLKEAEAVYRQTMVAIPTDPVARNGLAEILKETNRLEEAEAVYRQTMQKFPTDAIAPVGLAAVLRLQGPEHWEKALRLVEEVLRGGRNQAAAWAEKGRLLEKMERLMEAADAFERSRSVERASAPQVGSVTSQQRETERQKRATHEVASAGNQASGGREATAIEGMSAPQAGTVAGQRQATERPKDSGPVRYQAELGPLKTSDDSGNPTSGKVPEARPAYRAARLSRSQRAAWTSEARFLRRWARHGDDPERGRSPLELRRRAESLLDKVLSDQPHDRRAVVEKGLLLLDDGRFDEARELLSESAGRWPGTPVLLAALARVEREQARARSLRLREETKAEVFEAPDQLRALGAGFEPLIHLQKGRAVLALQDGQLRRELAAKELDKLHQWMRPHLDPESDSFEAWWSRRLNDQVFLPIPADADIRPDDVDDLSSRMEERAAEIDVLDETYGLKKDPRALTLA